MSKSPDAFRTISEVAEWLDTPAHVLRFWESKFTQVKPVKRAGGRRYYRPDDMALLAGIKILLHEQGLTIKGAQKLLREKGVKYVSGLGTDPREAGSAATAEVIDLHPAPTDETVSEDALYDESPEPAPIEDEPPRRVEPLSWDPDDPWPADPAPSGTDRPELTPLDPAEGVAVFTSGPGEGETGEAAKEDVPAEADEPEEVALPFVRARRSTADAGNPTRGVPADDAPRWVPAPPPDLPDLAKIEVGPGVLNDIIAIKDNAPAKHAKQIAVMAARLADIRERITSADR